MNLNNSQIVLRTIHGDVQLPVGLKPGDEIRIETIGEFSGRHLGNILLEVKEVERMIP